MEVSDTNVFKTNWQFPLLALFAALIPCGIKLWPLLAIGFVLWFYSGEYKKVNLPRRPSWSWVFVFFLFLHLLGYTYSDNKAGAFILLKNTTGFILFPLLLNSYPLRKSEFNILLVIFCFSCVTLSGYLIARALIICGYYGEPVYTYSKYSVLWHPSYFSMFLVFSMGVLYLGEMKLNSDAKKDMLLKHFCAAVLTTSLLLCCSKIGYITYALAMVFLAVFLITRRRSYSFLGLLAVSVVIGFAFITVVSVPVKRFDNMLFDYRATKEVEYTDLKTLSQKSSDKGLNKKESTMARIFLWSSALQVVKEHYLFGVGPGDVTSTRAALSRHYGLSIFDKYDTHNQYLETQLGLGIPGSLVLLVLTAGLFAYSIQKKDLLLSLFTILCALNFAVESMLLVDSFSLFFSLFIYLFIKKDKELNEPPVA